MNLIEEIVKCKSTKILVTGDRGTGKMWVALKLAEKLAEEMKIPFSVQENISFASEQIVLPNIKIKFVPFPNDLSAEELTEFDYWFESLQADISQEKCFVSISKQLDKSPTIKFKEVQETDIAFPSQEIMKDYKKEALKFMDEKRREWKKRYSRFPRKEK